MNVQVEEASMVTADAAEPEISSKVFSKSLYSCAINWQKPGMYAIGSH